MDCLEAENSITPAREEFAVRYLRWAEGEVHQEIDNDFSRIRMVRSRWVLHYLDFMESLSRARRLTAAIALLRSSVVHRTAREILNLQLSETDLEYGRAFQGRLLPINLRSESEERLYSGTKADDFRIDRVAFEKILIEECSKLSLLQQVPGYACRFQLQIGKWFLQTSIDVHSVYQLRYSHTITARSAQMSFKDHCPVQLKEGGVNVLNWLGVHPATEYTQLRPEDLTQTARFVAEMTRHFVKHAPVLLSGLTHDIEDSRDKDQSRVQQGASLENKTRKRNLGKGVE